MGGKLTAWLEYIETIHPSNWELGLERIGAVADRMNLREPAPTSVIVAGTNGKGSTCVCLEQILLAGGLTVGCTLSPMYTGSTNAFASTAGNWTMPLCARLSR